MRGLLSLVLAIPFAVGCPEAPRGEIQQSEESFVTEGSSGSGADDDGGPNDGNGDVDSGTDGSGDTDGGPSNSDGGETDDGSDGETDSEWPFAGEYSGEVVVSNRSWGEWCSGDMSITVEDGGTVIGDGGCSWEGGGSSGTFNFSIDGSLSADDEQVTGEILVDGGEYGSVSKPIDSGLHNADETIISWTFTWYEVDTVVFTRY